MQQKPDPGSLAPFTWHTADGVSVQCVITYVIHMLLFAAKLSECDRICTQMLLQSSGQNMVLTANEWLEDWSLWKSCTTPVPLICHCLLLPRCTQPEHGEYQWLQLVSMTVCSPFLCTSTPNCTQECSQNKTQDIVRNHEHLLVLSYQWLVIYNEQTSGLSGST